MKSFFSDRLRELHIKWVVAALKQNIKEKQPSIKRSNQMTQFLYIKRTQSNAAITNIHTHIPIQVKPHDIHHLFVYHLWMTILFRFKE